MKDFFQGVGIDQVNGTLIGTVPVSYTGGPDVWKTETIALEEVTGVHDEYFVFAAEDDENILYFDHWYFTERTGEHDLLAINAFVEDYKIDTLPGYDSTYIRVMALYTDGTREDVTAGTDFTFDH
ncbi:MAG: carbohydrate-binding protein [Bacteroidales bacterium]|nr:carbohydrate-binding protein [Bacteroidales bacterium]